MDLESKIRISIERLQQYKRVMIKNGDLTIYIEQTIKDKRKALIEILEEWESKVCIVCEKPITNEGKPELFPQSVRAAHPECSGGFV